MITSKYCAMNINPHLPLVLRLWRGDGVRQEEFKVEKGSDVCPVKEQLGCAQNSECQARASRTAPEQEQLEHCLGR